MPKRILQGVVVSDVQDKTVVVRIERRVMRGGVRPRQVVDRINHLCGLAFRAR